MHSLPSPRGHRHQRLPEPLGAPRSPPRGNPGAAAGSPSAGGPRSPPGPPGGACALRPLGAGPAPGAARSPAAAAAYFSHSAGTGPPRGRGPGAGTGPDRIGSGRIGSDRIGRDGAWRRGLRGETPLWPPRLARPEPAARLCRGRPAGGTGTGKGPGTGHRAPGAAGAALGRAVGAGGRQPRSCRRGSRPRSPSPSPLWEGGVQSSSSPEGSARNKAPRHIPDLGGIPYKAWFLVSLGCGCSRLGQRPARELSGLPLNQLGGRRLLQLLLCLLACSYLMLLTPRHQIARRDEP